MSEISTELFPNVCRTCLQKSNEMSIIFKDHLNLLLLECAAIQVMESDDLPKLICSNCSKLLINFKKFKETCHKNQNYLKKLVTEGNLENPKPETCEGSSIGLECTENNSEIESSLKLQEHETERCVDFKLTESKNVKNNKNEVEKFLNNEKNDHLIDAQCQESSSNDFLKQNQCTVCYKEFSSGYLIRRHLQTHPETRTVQLERCPVCSKMFYDKDNFRRHVHRHNNPPDYKCSLCSSQYYDLVDLVKHVKVKHKLKPELKCDLCDNKFFVQPELQKHQKRHQTVKNRTCKFCGKYSKNIKIHMLSHTNERPVKCDQCESCFKSNYLLKLHVKKAHQPEKLPVCHICGKKTKYPFHHLKSHTNQEKVSCDICNKLFSKHLLNGHKRSVHSMKRVHCDLCGKTVKHSSLFSHYKFTHQTTRPHSCSICHKSFKKNGYLQDHLRRHADFRPFACSNCAKRFKDKKTLKNHLLIHTQEKNHKCHICSKTFTQKVTMTAHLAVHLRKKGD